MTLTQLIGDCDTSRQNKAEQIDICRFCLQKKHLYQQSDSEGLHFFRLLACPKLQYSILFNSCWCRERSQTFIDKPESALSRTEIFTKIETEPERRNAAGSGKIQHANLRCPPCCNISMPKESTQEQTKAFHTITYHRGQKKGSTMRSLD